MAVDTNGNPVADPNEAANEEEEESDGSQLEEAGGDEEAEEEASAEPSGGDPTKALRAERGKRKAAQKKLKDLEAKVKQMEPLVTEYTNLLPVLPQLIAKAKANTGGGGTRTEVNQPTAEEVEELTAIAKDFGFETEDGQPDLQRAARAVQRMEKRFGGVVNRETAAVRKTAAAAQAQQIRERAYQAVDDKGNPYAKKDVIDQVFATIPPESLADPNTAIMALLIARGLGGPGEAGDEPVFRDGGGQRPDAPVELTPMEKAVAKIRGKSEKQWKQLSPKGMPEPSSSGWELESA